MGDVAKDLFAGSIGGAAQLVVGHPFDTIKVKLQSQPVAISGQLPKYSGAMDAVRQTIAAEGPRGLFKGMGAPLATVAAFNAVLFSVRGQMESLLRSEPGAPLSVNQQVVCGAGAGVAVSFLACPTELIKCRLQAQSAMAGSCPAALAVKYGGPMDVARHVVQSAGVMGLFKGLGPTLAREVPGNAVVFGVYEAIKQLLAGGQDTSKLGRGSLMLAGGLAGGCFWLSVYPTDVVKSVVQVDDYKNPKYSGSIYAFRKIIASQGVKGLYRGFGPAMARSVPANAACFLIYEDNVFYAFQVFLRLLGVATTLVAAILIITNKETHVLSGITVEARFTNTYAYSFFAYTNCIVSVFTTVSVFCVVLLLRSPARFFLMFLHDMIMGMLLAAACAAATTLDHIEKYGNKHIGWVGICGRFENYCHNVNKALASSYIALIIYLILASMFVYKKTYLTN